MYKIKRSIPILLISILLPVSFVQADIGPAPSTRVISDNSNTIIGIGIVILTIAIAAWLVIQLFRKND